MHRSQHDWFAYFPVENAFIFVLLLVFITNMTRCRYFTKMVVAMLFQSTWRLESVGTALQMSRTLQLNCSEIARQLLWNSNGRNAPIGTRLISWRAKARSWVTDLKWHWNGTVWKIEKKWSSFAAVIDLSHPRGRAHRGGGLKGDSTGATLRIPLALRFPTGAQGGLYQPSSLAPPLYDSWESNLKESLRIPNTEPLTARVNWSIGFFSLRSQRLTGAYMDLWAFTLAVIRNHLKESLRIP